MKPPEILLSLRSRGFTLAAVNGLLWVTPPPGGALTADEVDAVRFHRDGILDALDLEAAELTADTDVRFFDVTENEAKST